MAFHRRFIDEESIRRSAKGEYNMFKRYMTSADSYVTSDSFSTDFYREFREATETKRRELQEKLNLTNEIN